MITYEDIQEFMEEVDKARKPPLTVPQMVEIFAETMRQEKNPEMSANLLHEEYSEWLKEWELSSPLCTGMNYPSPSPERELKELADLTYVIYGYARARGWDLDEAVRRVHQNNIDRCVQPDGSVKYRADGKVIKRDNPPKIDLSDLV